MEMSEFRIEEGEGLGGSVMPRATSSSASTSGRRAASASAAASSGCGSATDPALRGGQSVLRAAGAGADPLPTCSAALTGGLLVLVVVVLVGVVDHDVLEALNVFKQRLEALIPLGGGFVQKDQALVDEAELNVAEHCPRTCAATALRPVRWPLRRGSSSRRLLR